MPPKRTSTMLYVPRSNLTAERVRQLLHYDPLTGEFTRNGSIAGYRRKDGYVSISVDGIQHLASRLAWVYTTGEWPIFTIDHEDLDRSNNKWTNLKDKTHIENMHNQKVRKNSKTGVLGVCPERGKFVAQICKNYKVIRLGRFDTIEEASAAYKEAKQRLHPSAPIR